MFRSIVCSLVVALLANIAAWGAEISFQREVVDAQPPSRPYYKMVGDLDQDGRMDVIVAGARGPLVWYANPNWTKAAIASEGWNGVGGKVADIDQDGDLDIAMGGVVWVSNPLVGGGKWSVHVVDKQRAHDIELRDVNLDGRLDIVARDQSAFGKAGNQLFFYFQQDGGSWLKMTKPCPHGEGISLADLDEDGDSDVVIGGRWYENNRQRDPTSWPEHIYTNSWQEPDAKVALADLNGDGRQDIVLTPAELRGEDYKIAWYEASPDPKQGDWREHVVTASIEAVIHSLAVGDFDLDGAIDLAYAEMHQGADPDEVVVLLNKKQGTQWRKLVLSTDGSHDIVAADIDGDGDLDILGANHAGERHPLELWRNNVNP